MIRTNKEIQQIPKYTINWQNEIALLYLKQKQKMIHYYNKICTSIGTSLYKASKN